MRIKYSAFLLVASVFISLKVYAADAEPVAISGDSSNRVDVVILCEGYTASQQDKCRSDTLSFINNMLTLEPFNSYRTHFNFWLVPLVSAQSGADHPSRGVYVDTALDAYYDCQNIERLICINTSKAYTAAAEALPEYDYIMVIVNDTTYGGSGGEIAVFSVNSSAYLIAAHEFGHTHGGLADEYEDPYPGFPPGCPEPNVTCETERERIPWKDWILPSTPIPTPESFWYADVIGLFEGARYQSEGVYRPKMSCIMRSLSSPFCEVCREALVLEDFVFVDPIESVLPPVGNVDIGNTPVEFSATLVQPYNLQTVVAEWSTETGTIAQNTASVMLSSANFPSSGIYHLTLSVKDTTPFVRTDTENRTVSVRIWTLYVQNTTQDGDLDEESTTDVETNYEQELEPEPDITETTDNEVIAEQEQDLQDVAEQIYDTEDKVAENQTDTFVDNSDWYADNSIDTDTHENQEQNNDNYHEQNNSNQSDLTTLSGNSSNNGCVSSNIAFTLIMLIFSLLFMRKKKLNLAIILLSTFVALSVIPTVVHAKDSVDEELNAYKKAQQKKMEELKKLYEKRKKEIVKQQSTQGNSSKTIRKKRKGSTPIDGLAGEVDIRQLVINLAEFCGYNIIIDTSSRLGGGRKVKIYAHEKFTKKQACEIFRILLELDDRSFYKANAFLKLIKRREALNAPIPVIPEQQRIPVSPKVDFAIAFYRPKHLINFPDHFSSLARFFVSKYGKSVFIKPDTTMLVDERTNLERILRLFNILDKPEPPFKIYYIEFKHLWITDFAKMVEELFPKPDLERWKPGKGAGYGPKYLVAAVSADERTNKLVVVCNDEAYKKILELKESLDIASATEGMVRTYYLQHQEAKHVAEVVNNAIRGHAATKRRGAAKAATLSGEVKVVAYEKLNAILVSGLPKDVETVINLIKKLDSPRRQVFLEVHILELTESSTGSRGVALWYVRNDDGTISFVSSSHAGAQPLVLDPTSLMGLAVGVRGEEVEGTDAFVQGLRLPSFATILKLLEQTSKVNVISSPFMLAQDGEEAKIVVGKSVPFIVGGSIDRFGFPMITIQHQDVALQMKIVPKVSKGGTVRMEIEVQIEDIESMSDLFGPTTSKRAIKTTVITKDGATVVIGGLTKDVETTDYSRIPLLGDLPVIGALFRTKTKRKSKINLLFFIKPYVIDSEEDLKRLYKAKVKEQKEFVEKFVHTKPPTAERPIDWERKIGPLESIRQQIYPIQ